MKPAGTMAKGHDAPARGKPPAAGQDGGGGRGARLLRRGGFALSVVLALVAQHVISLRGAAATASLTAGAVLYAVAVVVLFATLVAGRRAVERQARRQEATGDEEPPAPSRPWSAPRRGLVWWLAAIVVTSGLYLRLYEIDLIPRGLNNDEAINALEVDDIRAGREYASVAGALSGGTTRFHTLTERGLRRETLFHYLAAASFEAPVFLNLLRALPAPFGLQVRLMQDPLMDLVFPLRTIAVAAGALSILALFWLVRARFGLRTAVVAAAFLAVSPWHLLYSRVGLRAILAPLLAIVAVALFLRARDSGRLRDHAAWGAVVGLGLWSYTSFRAVPLAFLVFLLAGRLWPGAAGARRALAGFAVAAAALLALLSWAPYGPDGGPAGFLVRGAYAALVTPQADHWGNLVSALTMAQFFPSRYAVIQNDAFISDGVSTVYGLIGLEPESAVIAALAAIGLLYAGWRAFGARRRDPACALVVLCFVSLVLTVGLAGPSLTRLLPNVPWLCVFAALAAERTARHLASPRRAWTEWIGTAAAALLVSVAAAQGVSNYFLRAGRSEKAMQHFGGTQTIMGLFVRAMPPEPLTYVLHSRGPETLRYLAGDRPGTQFVTDPTRLDLDAIIASPRTAVFVIEYARPFAEALRHLMTRYPQGDMTQIADARLDPDKIIFYTFTLWKDASGRPLMPPAGPEPGAPPLPPPLPPGGGPAPPPGPPFR